MLSISLYFFSGSMLPAVKFKPKKCSCVWIFRDVHGGRPATLVRMGFDLAVVSKELYTEANVFKLFWFLVIGIRLFSMPMATFCCNRLKGADERKLFKLHRHSTGTDRIFRAPKNNKNWRQIVFSGHQSRFLYWEWSRTTSNTATIAMSMCV